MVPLLELWLPILLSAVFVFVVSSVVHMALPLHKSDCAPMKGEDEVLAAIRKNALAPGQYMFPHAPSMKAMSSPEMLAKFQRGPVGNMTLRPDGVPAIGKALGQWFVLTLVIGACVAYVAGLGLARGAEAMLVFRAASAAALVAYGASPAMESIWKGVPWSTTAKFLLDGFLYALTTGATFAWLWPAA
jgi:hypothetical protein